MGTDFNMWKGAACPGGRTARRSITTVLALAVFALQSPDVIAQGGGTCSRSDFEEVVDKAAVTLADLNAKKTPAFQSLLRQLKAKRNWSSADFIKLGTPYVQDEKITEFDTESNELLASIADKGEQGAAAATPDCKLLDELRGIMKVLVETQMAKWDYMYAKLARALKE